MRTSRAPIIVTTALALSLPLAACGRSSNASYAGAPMAASEEKAYDTSDGYEGEYYAYGDEAYMEEPEPAAGTGGSDFTPSLTTTSDSSIAATQKLIYTASVSIDTTNYKESIEALRDLMTSCDAFAESENEWVHGSLDLHTIQVTLRVPADKFDALIAGMDGIGGTITNRSSQVTNITRTYADNEAIIEGLEIQEERLLEMMKQADTVEDMILVEERLSEVQTQLNRARTSRSTMDSDVSLSTVVVSISEVRYETTTGHTSYFTRVANAFADMWDGFVEGIGDFIIGLIYAIPAIVIAGGLIFLGARAIRKRRAKKATAAAAAFTSQTDIPQPSDPSKISGIEE